MFTVFLTGTNSLCIIPCLLNVPIKNIFNFTFRKKNFVGLGDDLATLVWTQNNPFEVIPISSSSKLFSTPCSDLKHPTLI
jgi:hypothetical protein